MFSHYVPRLRTVAMLALLLILSAVAYGFAAANTVPVSGAGDGSGAISGYTVSGISYTLNGTDPTKLDKVVFTLAPAVVGAPAPTTVKIRLDSSTNWYSCTVATNVATCNTVTPQATVAGAASLQVVALGN